jgi:DNA polymerase-3 subunit alpha
MSAALTADSGDVEKIAEIIAECKRMNIPVLPPNINESYGVFTTVSNRGGVGKGITEGADKIRFGLNTIKNFGEGIGESIVSERKTGGQFKSLADFLDRIKDKNLNKKSLESLIKTGAMDEFGERGALVANLENILTYNKEKNKNGENQDSLFGLMADTSTVPTLKLEPAPEATVPEKLAWEKELLGLYISGHPLDKFAEKLAGKSVNIKKIIEGAKEGAPVVIGGIVEEAKNIVTKKGDAMLFLKISDLTGSVECVVFPRVFQEFKDMFVLEKCIAIKGKISMRNGAVSIIAEKAKAL